MLSKGQASRRRAQLASSEVDFTKYVPSGICKIEHGQKIVVWRLGYY